MARRKNSPETKLDMRSIEARREWMEHWRRVANRSSPQYLEPLMVQRSLKSWQGVSKSGLRSPRQVHKRTGTEQHG